MISLIYSFLIRASRLFICFFFFLILVPNVNASPWVVKKLLEQENCRLGVEIQKKNERQIRDLSALVNESSSHSSLNESKWELDLAITNPKSLNCYLRINLTSTYAHLLKKMKNYENSIVLYKKASSYKGLDRNYREYLKNSISSLESLLTKKIPTEVQQGSDDGQTRNSNSESILVENLRLQISTLEDTNNKLADYKYQSEQRIKSKDNVIKRLQRDISTKDKQIRDLKSSVRKLEEAEGNINFWIIISAIIVFIYLLIRSERNKENSMSNEQQKETKKFVIDEDIKNIPLKPDP